MTDRFASLSVDRNVMPKSVIDFVRKKFVSDFLWGFLSIVFLGVAGVLVNTFIGRYLGSSSVGIFNYSYSIYTVVSVFSVFGLNTSTIRYIAQHKDNKEELTKILTASIALVFFMALVITSAIFLISGILFSRTSIDPRYIRILLLAIPPFSINQVIVACLNGLRLMRQVAFYRSLRWVLITIYIFVVLALNGNIDNVLYAFTFTELLMLAILVHFVHRLFPLDLSSFDKTWFSSVLRFGSRVTLTQSIHQLDSKLPIIIMGFYLDEAGIGVFSLAFTVMAGLLMIPNAVVLNFNPIISELWNKDRSVLLSHIRKVRKATFALVTLTVLVSAVLYPQFIRFFMSTEEVYVQSVPVFSILLVGVFVLGSVRWSEDFLPMTGDPLTQTKIRLISLVISALLCIVLIGNFGLIGAAYAATLSRIFYSALLILTVSKRLL